MIRDYISIARPDHWFKNVFMIPGIFLAWIAYRPESIVPTLIQVLLGVFATCLICSSNYTINEWLDASKDRSHPEKKHRPAAAGRIQPMYAYLQWIILAGAGLAIAWFIGLYFFWTEFALFMMGIIYNVKPLRSKERPYIDVLSESVNNPLRFLLGWYSICILTPPASLLVSYWMFGAYFMAIKRFAELRHISDPSVAAEYRESFVYYTPERLLISIMFYATSFSLFLGVFLIRYRIELILSIPFIAGFMAFYLKLGLLENSPTQHPESLYKQKKFMVYVCLTTIVLIACYGFDMNWLDRIFDPTIPSFTN